MPFTRQTRKKKNKRTLVQTTSFSPQMRKLKRTGSRKGDLGNSENSNSSLKKFVTSVNQRNITFFEIHRLFEKAQRENIILDCKFGIQYLSLLKTSNVDNQIAKAEILLKYFQQKKVLCSSKLFLEYVYICRNNNFIQPSTDLLDLLKNLNIHRPSFKLLASIITTYCTLGVKETKFVDDVRSVYDTMKNKYKYTPNTYLLNSVLNMYCKMKEKEYFWDLVVETITENKTQFDTFTYGSLMEQCLNEKNYTKMKTVYNDFIAKSYTNFKNDRNLQYVKSLRDKMIQGERQQQAQYFNDPMWHSFLLSL